jgi:glycosyltransferase involved in cell wall biosynthesis
LSDMFLIILGALPPPRGGVSTHVERLIPYLEDEGIDLAVWDHSRVRKSKAYCISLRKEPLRALRCLIRPGVKVLHCPLSLVTIGKTVFLLLLKAVCVRLTVTFVGSWERTTANSRLNERLVLCLAGAASHVVTVSGNFRDSLTANGIPGSRVSVIPAFIPAKDMLTADQSLPGETAEFCRRKRPLAVTYAYGPDMHKGEDLYGLDLVIQLAADLRTDVPDAGFLIIIPEITNRAYFEKLKEIVRDKKLDDRIHWVIGDRYSFTPFLRNAGLFIRATNTDGDALTLREALYCGVPSVASDVCGRPEGTILFRNRDGSDLLRAARIALKAQRSGEVKQSREGNNAELYISVFKRAAGL